MPQLLLNRLNSALILTVSIVAACFMKTNGGIAELFIRLSVLPILLLPRILKKFCKMNTGGVFETIYILYIFFAQVLSGIFSLYVTTAFYDKFMHLLSGVLSAAAGFVLIQKFGLEKTKTCFLNLFFVSITFSIACLWEFFEFYGDTLLGRNAQRVIQTGVTDTMLDIHYALIGCIVYCIIFSVFRGKKSSNINKH